jgi:hypothetical protein
MKKPTRITYLFGAGASIGDTANWCKKFLRADRKFPKLPELILGIPITKDLDTFRVIFHHIIENESFDLANDSRHHEVTVKQIGELLLDLEKAFVSQLSPDTYGRSLKISKRKDEYNSFKNALAHFINLMESITYSDKRYSHLLSNFINIESGCVSENISFLTYNFDASAEKSFMPFWPPKSKGLYDLEDIRDKHYILNTTNVDPEVNYENKSVWIKLHGAASDFISEKSPKYVLEIDDYSFKDSDRIKVPDPNNHGHGREKQRIVAALDSISKIRKELTESEESCIRFAWDIPDDDKLLNLALKKLEMTQILVVVGYTFPVFNQKNDFKLLQALSEGRFEKLIIQLPGTEGEEVKNRVGEMFRNIGKQNNIEKVEVYTDCTAFHIPVEYFQKYEPSRAGEPYIG